MKPAYKVDKGSILKDGHVLFAVDTVYDLDCLQRKLEKAESMVKEFEEARSELMFLWKEYANKSDEELTTGAQVIKDLMQSHFEFVEQWEADK